MNDLHVLGIAGSLRKGSTNRAMLRAAAEVAPEGVTVETFDLIEIPLYNGDVDLQGRPEAVTELQTRIAEADALLVATPEYNGSYSGVLKNAIDWASRSFDRPVFVEKPVAIMGAGGRMGTARSQVALRQLLHGQGCFVLPRPVVHISILSTEFDPQGNLVDDAMRQQIADLVTALASFARRLRPD